MSIWTEKSPVVIRAELAAPFHDGWNKMTGVTVDGNISTPPSTSSGTTTPPDSCATGTGAARSQGMAEPGRCRLDRGDENAIGAARQAMMGQERTVADSVRSCWYRYPRSTDESRQPNGETAPLCG